MKLSFYLKLDRPIKWSGGWIADAIGPFDTLDAARAYYEKHVGTFNLKRVDSVEICDMVKP